MATEPSEKRSRSGSQTRQRWCLVGVRLRPSEHAVLTEAAARFGKTPAAMLRETFLIAEDHAVLPDLLGTYPEAADER